jgi:hypothetical protein
MIKSIQLFIFLVFAATASFAQSFEGMVKYQNTYKSKMPTLTDEQFSAMMGTSMEYLMKGSNYKTITNGNYILWQLYISKDNKIYNKIANSPAILWNDVTINTDEVLKAETNKNVVEILGYKCDELILTCKSGIQKYYYNPSLKLDAKLYENFKYQNWYEYVSRANAVPLKMTIDNAQFYLESVATDVQKKNIDASVFTLPPDAKLEKSPF